MATFTITSSMVSMHDDAKFFAKDAGWQISAPLVTFDKAKTFRSEKAARLFLEHLKGAGYTSFRVIKWLT